MKRPEAPDENKTYFEDIPDNAQEAIIDLIVSIIKNKRREQEVDASGSDPE